MKILSKNKIDALIQKIIIEPILIPEINSIMNCRSNEKNISYERSYYLNNNKFNLNKDLIKSILKNEHCYQYKKGTRQINIKYKVKNKNEDDILLDIKVNALRK